LQANLIGKFDVDTIESHKDNFLRGKLATWSPKETHDKLVFENKDCQAPPEIDSDEDDRLLQEEILREIMEEEAARKQEESKRKNVGSNKTSGKGKGKKKGKKS